jgi:hypothetical protein
MLLPGWCSCAGLVALVLVPLVPHTLFVFN